MNSAVRVLLADDDQIVLEHLGALLGRDPRVDLVATVTSGAEALSILAKKPVDVALLDVNMPVLDGVSTARILKASFPTITIVMLTAFERESSLAESLELGVRGFLTKDTRFSRLIEQILQAHEGATVLGPRPIQLVTANYLAHKHRQEEFSEFVKAVHNLPDRHRPIFELIAQGFTNKAIARQLGLTENSVRTYASEILTATGCANRCELAFTAAKSGVVQDDSELPQLSI
ncbi:response regulator transcription factor [Arcanobacterium hippocoleae]|uniref:DNA-binding NarL/FixJ family response regulator n=2 Tax=Arcanobacterium hippocoleae TaxID=149017 RepID=A0ABU1T2B2_9ACTO|nr:response regulator transcription factor [Arcanobacterium hippocoleae]MDR6939395.1 DNA-binding NarL/FixJ family response regulator [Arcanobacterium hippocoleae]